MSSQQQQQQPMQQGGEEDFQPTSIQLQRQSNKRRSIPRLHHESVRMKELKNLQAELSNIIPDNNNATSPASADGDVLQCTNTNSRRASTSSTLSASSTTHETSTTSISNSPYQPKNLDRYTTPYTTLPTDIDVLGLSIDDNNNDVKSSSNNRPKFRPYQPSPNINNTRRPSYIPRRTSDESKHSTRTTTSIGSDTIGSLPRRASKVDDYDNFLAFINDEEPPATTEEVKDTTTVELKSVLLNDSYDDNKQDSSERSTSPSKKILQSFRYTKKNSKNHQSQLPTYSFLIKDDNNGRDITLPNTKWWHYIFIFSFVSLLVCIIQLWVSCISFSLIICEILVLTALPFLPPIGPVSDWCSYDLGASCSNGI